MFIRIKSSKKVPEASSVFERVSVGGSDAPVELSSTGFPPENLLTLDYWRVVSSRVGVQCVVPMPLLELNFPF